MPMVDLKELGIEVKPGDKVEFMVKGIKDGMVELSYENPEVEPKEMSEETMPLSKLRSEMVKKHGETDTEGM